MSQHRRRHRRCHHHHRRRRPHSRRRRVVVASSSSSSSSSSLAPSPAPSQSSRVTHACTHTTTAWTQKHRQTHTPTHASARNHRHPTHTRTRAWCTALDTPPLDTPSTAAHTQALKNPAELAGLRAAHFRDAVAKSRALAWVEETITTTTTTAAAPPTAAAAAATSDDAASAATGPGSGRGAGIESWTTSTLSLTAHGIFTGCIYACMLVCKWVRAEVNRRSRLCNGPQ